ncbi:hypothetical protein P7K49_038084 [Saguinus oedipus]|uniref:ATP synthase F(0) complex subunit e, mitochondrial n=1 Tax=Saguinus oedipus TaxID=9490 RepID=A0ABQ9TDM8_SAGOE|nr:hypothetical protein P7K49_038084 [Saguinus oedipus]
MPALALIQEHTPLMPIQERMGEPLPGWPAFTTTATQDLQRRFEAGTGILGGDDRDLRVPEACPLIFVIRETANTHWRHSGGGFAIVISSTSLPLEMQKLRAKVRDKMVPPVQFSPLIKLGRYSFLFLGMAYGATRYSYLKPRAAEERRIAAEEKQQQDELKRIAKELAEAQEDTILK